MGKMTTNEWLLKGYGIKDSTDQELIDMLRDKDTYVGTLTLLMEEYNKRLLKGRLVGRPGCSKSYELLVNALGGVPYVKEPKFITVEEKNNLHTFEINNIVKIRVV